MHEVYTPFFNPALEGSFSVPWNPILWAPLLGKASANYHCSLIPFCSTELQNRRPEQFYALSYKYNIKMTYIKLGSKKSIKCLSVTTKIAKSFVILPPTLTLPWALYPSLQTQKCVNQNMRSVFFLCPAVWNEVPGLLSSLPHSSSLLCVSWIITCMFGASVWRFEEVLPISHCLSEGAVWGSFLVCCVVMLWHH